MNYDYVPVIYRKYLVDTCAQFGVPVKLMADLIMKESRWNPKTKSINYTSKGHVASYDCGLVQLNSQYIEKDFKNKFNDGKKIDPFDPYTSIRIGVRHLRWAYDLTSKWEDAILVYNGGYTRWKEKRVPASTYKYLRDIIPQEGMYDFKG